MIFSAHGVPKSVPAEARRRNLFALDATCPLVTKVHREAEIHHRRGREIVLIGHAGHPEVVGTMGQLPDGAVTLVRDGRGRRKRFRPQDPDKLAYVTQTTLSVDDTAEIVRSLRSAFPEIVGAAQGRHLLRHHQPPGGGEARRAAGRRDDRGRRAEFVELAAAEGSRRARRLPARVLVQRAGDIDWTLFGNIRSLGVTAGASAPEVLVEEIIDAFAERYTVSVETCPAPRRLFFPLPRALREEQPIARSLDRLRARSAAGNPRRRSDVRMAVYTDVVGPRSSAGLPSPSYDLGTLLSYKGIAEGVENSNFLVHTGAGHFILTLYEKRVTTGDLPFFLGLMEHLAARGITCPQPVKNRNGEALGRLCRPAGRDRDLPRRHVDPPAGPRQHCAAVGEALARLHLAGADFPMQRATTRSRSRAGGRSTKQRGAARRHGAARARRRDRAANSAISRRRWPRDPAAGRDPRRSVSRQRVLPRRPAVRA